ncbi:dihydroxy-acid dehydratase domain-containing protein, partial [Cohnella faecalis]|uniref:dihydroxy-acid dehydratase domain-containing protein n=1 Tax=Cohnella faecalis TaxID=2315694 RepID=UPI003989C6D8
MKSWLWQRTPSAAATGICMVMGTASTMASIAEAIGMAPCRVPAIPRRNQPPSSHLG